MKILIAGAQGQVGSELTAIAKQRNYEIIAATRSDLDISQLDNVNTYFSKVKPDIVINAAAYTAVDKAEEEQDSAYAINRDGAKNLATACSTQNIPLLHISTDYVFDGSKEEAYSEDDEVAPLGIYGISKWQGEEEIRSHLPQHIILRVAWVFGANGNNFVKTMLRLAANRNKLNIVSDQFGGPTSAKSIAKTLLNLVDIYHKDNSIEWGTYHYCGKGKTSWYNFAKEIFNQANISGVLNKEIQINAIKTEEYPTPAKRPKNSMLDCTKIMNTFGIEPQDWRIELKQVLSELT